MTPFPFATESTWDRITLAGITFGGLAAVEDASRKRKVDVPRRGGAEGASLILRRRELAEPKITLTGWTSEHLREMERIARAVFPLERSEQHNAVTASHPALVFHGIDRLFVHELEGPDPDPGKGTFKLVLHTYQWHPTPPRARSTVRRPAATPPIETRPTAFQGIPQPAPTPPSQTATPRRRT